MIKCYKIGLDRYSNGDRNSGLYEYGLIRNELVKVENIIGENHKDAIFIINGAFNPQIDSKLFDEISMIKRKNGVCVFVMTDSCALSSVMQKQVIDCCDFVLHQVPPRHDREAFGQINCRQYYSYIPELFYRKNEKVLKDKKLIFGGNNLRRCDKIAGYMFNDNGQLYDGFDLFCKDYYGNGGDTRLEYEKYYELSKRYKYTIIVARDEYNRSGWITSRFVEAISCGIIPFVDFEYDKFCWFVSKDSFLRISGKNDVITKIDQIESNCIIREDVNDLIKNYALYFDTQLYRSKFLDLCINLLK